MGEVSEKVLRIAEEISKVTACEHYRLVLDEGRVPAITGSKIGGKPYWPAGMEYPVDPQGKKMLMIMQVNCQEAELKAPLPEQGMLQWFISVNPDLMYGCRGNFDEEGNGFKIIYHPTIVDAAPPVDVPTHDTVDSMLSPVKREVALDCVPQATAMGVSDGRFNHLFGDVARKLTGIDLDGQMWSEELSNEDCLHLERNLGMKRPCHQMLGYPVYTQDEARRDIDRHDTLLFQLDSQFSTTDNRELVMWGDMGSGFIFINHDDLAARDFSRAYYCWDCG